LGGFILTIIGRIIILENSESEIVLLAQKCPAEPTLVCVLVVLFGLATLSVKDIEQNTRDSLQQVSSRQRVSAEKQSIHDKEREGSLCVDEDLRIDEQTKICFKKADCSESETGWNPGTRRHL